MIIYSSIFVLIEDIVNLNSEELYTNLQSAIVFCEFCEDFLSDLNNKHLIQVLDRGLPQLSLDDVYCKLDEFKEILKHMSSQRSIIYSRHKNLFKLPWQEHTYIKTDWEDYEFFIANNFGIYIYFDRSCDPYLDLPFQIKELYLVDDSIIVK
jgi:hypothetical protein